MHYNTITGKVTSIAYGGQGIIRHEGVVIFVPFAAPGDLVECRIVKRKKSFAIAELIKVLSPGPGRVSPPCPYFGECGGCQYQHLDYATQLAIKKKNVLDALQRIGNLSVEDIEVIPAETQWAYRRHITLQLKPRNGLLQAGYIALDNETLLPIQQCRIFLEAGHSLFTQVILVLEKMKASVEGKVMILKLDDGCFLLHFHFKAMPENCLEVLKSAMEMYPEWKGCLAKTPGKEFQLGQQTTQMTLDGLHFEYSPSCFMQNHPEQSARIYKTVKGIAASLKIHCVLDLYCGIGITSLLLAKEGATVTGIELNPAAIKFAKENAKKNNLNVDFICGTAEHKAKEEFRKKKPELVLINPPREGMSASMMQTLIHGMPQQILYVSCQPATLSRDLGTLCKSGYDLIRCQAFDMFPQTGHVETLALLKIR